VRKARKTKTERVGMGKHFKLEVHTDLGGGADVKSGEPEGTPN